MLLIRHILLTSLLLTTGCGFYVAPCSEDSDCPRGSRCLRPVNTESAQCLVVDVDMGEQPDVPADDPDMGVEERDEGTPSGDCAPEACGEDEPNNTPNRAVSLNRLRIGCGSAGEWSVVRQDLLCEDDVDHYVVPFQNCFGQDFSISVELRPSDEQCSDSVTFRPELGCGNRDITCERQDGASVITYRVRSSLEREDGDFRFNVTGSGAAYELFSYAH